MNIARPVSKHIISQTSISQAPLFTTNTISTQPFSSSSRIVEKGYVVQSPILIQKQSHVIETQIARNDTQATIPLPMFVLPQKEVSTYNRRQSVEVREGICLRITNTFSSPGPACLKCVPCWLLSLLVLMILSGFIFGIIKYLLIPSGQCRFGLHYLDEKCYGCPQGANWDGTHCIKDTLIIKGSVQSQTNSGGILNEQNEYPDKTKYNIDKTVVTTTQTPEGRQQKISRFNKQIQQKDVTVHHLRHKI